MLMNLQFSFRQRASNIVLNDPKREKLSENVTEDTVNRNKHSDKVCDYQDCNEKECEK